ncbi:FAD-binding oxidoreductase [Ruegeria pomeroyi]|uniref:Oxidoreductase, FAD-binding protein n=2 Tax=Ruegeria pomeroyi TaxID=89184 RepID=Q5LML1_RUEPO|nr:FAD-dependent oxidoreductase [Ruegeria pomeroyi]HCE70895.1 FAD-dependent oxidoreductase [Ruegeria sp.]AAV96777.1 oxidoreductase, FAD-binding protein [Ruegeria pomeroyi DSS-3]NVK96319.1 FAD-dependent oxidoreductase [Ruegeria pomeroyi]NVL00265.1 FAD-dependent oxidoreductase [Ruegeria pomeroyi]QWV10307.1 FAD-binding oxidoreductase [Ruegeria pomeroyi]
MAMADVTIRGAGIFGLSIAWACVLRGARVQVVDPFGPGAGSSGGLVGALAPHVPENWNAKKAFQFDSLIMAEGFWAGVEAAGGVSPGYGRTGRIQPLADERAVDLADERAENARTLWQGQAEWRVCPVDEMGSWCPPSPTGLVVHDTLSARMHPRRACAALVGALAVRGVEVLAEAPDRGQVIHATGIAGLEELNRARGRLVGTGVKGQAALLRFDAGRQAPQLFADTVHIVPHADGTLAIGSTSERDYDDPTSTDAALDTVLDRAMQAVPLLHGAEVIERWAGVRPRSRSRAPMLGAHPLYPDQFIANGGFKIGFGMAPKVAHVMAELVLEGQDNIPQDFRPEASL